MAIDSHTATIHGNSKPIVVMIVVIEFIYKFNFTPYVNYRGY